MKLRDKDQHELVALWALSFLASLRAGQLRDVVIECDDEGRLSFSAIRPVSLGDVRITRTFKV